MKNLFLGLCFFFLGSIFSFVLFFWKNHSQFEPIITHQVVGNKKNYPKTNFSLDQAPSDSLQGQILDMSPEVFWQSRTATAPAQLINLITIQQGEKLITGEKGNLKIEFASAGAITIFSQSEVEVIQSLPVNFVFNQPKGKAVYKVLGQSPISVISFNLLATLKNGQLDINANEKTGEIILSLKNGKATVAYNSPSFISKVWDLSDDDVFIYDSGLRRGYFR